MSFSPSRILINGTFSKSDLRVSIFSPSFQYGLNIFEGIRAYRQNDGTIKTFMVHSHIDRLINSSKLIGFNIDLNSKLIQDDINFLLEQEKPNKDIYIKYMLCFLGEGNWAQIENIDRVVFFYPLESNLQSQKLSSTANFSSYKRISSNTLSPQIKCGANYINSRMAFLESKRYGCDFPLLINENGYISESSGACIFIIKDNNLLTPNFASDILKSITREVIINLVSDNKIIPIKNIFETQLSRFDILSADEVFLVGTNIEIRIIRMIDNIKFDNKVTTKIIKEFNKLVRSI